MKNVKIIFSVFAIVLIAAISLNIGCSNPSGDSGGSSGHHSGGGGGGVGFIANPLGEGPAPVSLGTAGTYVILGKSAITTTGVTAITGDIGLSPAAASNYVGFGLVMDASNQFSTSALVTGRVYAADYEVPTPANMTAAISSMETAYTDAAGRAIPTATELGAGDISGLTIVPGLYKWGTGVVINTNVTLNGGPNDVWIFQISQGLTMADGAGIILAGGAQAKNIFWQIFGVTTLNAGAHLEGIVMCQTNIEMLSGATVNGRLFAQTAVTLIANTVTQP